MVSKEIIEENLPLLAIQQLTENWMDEANGCRIYAVVQNWHKEELPKHSGTFTANDLQEFEDALNKPSVLQIYIPASTAVTKEMLLRITARNQGKKPIFIDAR